MSAPNKKPGRVRTSTELQFKSLAKGTNMNEVSNTTAMTAGQEMICDRVERLAIELSGALAEWAGGRFMGMVYPAGHPASFHFRQCGANPETRLMFAKDVYEQCLIESAGVSA